MADMFGQGVTDLPERTKLKLSLTERVAKQSVPLLIVEGLGTYAGIVVFMTLVQFVIANVLRWEVVTQTICLNKVSVTSFLDLLYFNTVTIMTIGYGDMTPSGVGRVIAGVEAVAGVGLFGVIVGVAVIKTTLPRRSSIIFSRYCYFSIDDARFVVVFVNGTKTRLINADLCSLLKINKSDWTVRSAYRAPYVGDSAWTFSVDELTGPYLQPYKYYQDDFGDLRIFTKDDGLKFGIKGSMGLAEFSSSMKYTFDKCWVIKSKSDLPTDRLEHPQWGTDQFAEDFHFVPSNPETFLDYAERRGATII